MKKLSLAVLFLSAVLLAGCGPSEMPKDLMGSYVADAPELGLYAQKVTLDLMPMGRASLVMASDEGQRSSVRAGQWEYKRGKVLVTLFVKDLASKGGERLQPDEILTLRLNGATLRGEDLDKARWKGAALLFTKAIRPVTPEN